MSFALVVPGRPLSTDFKQLPNDVNKVMTIMENPSVVREVTICLLTPDIPPGFGAAVYYSLPPFNEWQYLGFVSVDKPTVVFRAPWYEQIPVNTPSLQIGIALEKGENLLNMQPSDPREEEKALEIAQGIAQDLHNFMASFTQTTGQFAHVSKDLMVIPTNAVDLWFTKFLTKHKRTPYFFLKKN